MLLNLYAWGLHACLQPTKRKCLFLYYYFLDQDFGLIHVKVQT